MLEVCWIHENKTIIDKELEINFKKIYRQMTRVKRARCYNLAAFSLALTCKGNIAVKEASNKAIESANNLMNSIEINNAATDFLFFGGSPTKIIIFIAIVLGTCLLKPFMKWLYAEKQGVEAYGYSSNNGTMKVCKDALVVLICLIILFLPILLF